MSTSPKEDAQSIYDDLNHKDIYLNIESEHDFLPVVYNFHPSVRGHGFQRTAKIKNIEHFLKAVAKCDLPGFIFDGEDKFGAAKLQETSLSKYFKHVMKTHDHDSDDIHQFSEEVELTLDCLHQMNLAHENLEHPHFKNRRGNSYIFEYFNRLIEVLKIKMKSEDFISRRRRRKERAKRQYDSGSVYIAKLFESTARLLVLRIDLGYRDALNNSTFCSEVSLEQAHKDFARFQNNMRSNQLFEHMAGQIWKLEQGITKGFHFHLMMFFDGSKVHKDAYIAQGICDYWEKVITHKKGIAYNCNRYKTGYRNCGIGMISHDDHQLRQNLLKALAYMTKSDQYLRIRDANVRTFGRGVFPKPNQHKRGRPRRNDS